MPYLNIALCAPASAQTTGWIAALLTDLTAEVLRKKRDLTVVRVEYAAPESWYIGGTALAARGRTAFHLDIKVTEGSNTRDEKAAFVERVFAGLEAALGRLDPTSYVVIHELRADAWGYGGRTQEFRYAAGKAG